MIRIALSFAMQGRVVVREKLVSITVTTSVIGFGSCVALVLDDVISIKDIETKVVNGSGLEPVVKVDSGAVTISYGSPV